jgi:hypothetical protein
MKHFPNISYHLPGTTSHYPSLIYNPIFKSDSPDPCELVSPEFYSFLPWFGAPLPDFSFAIEPETKERKIDEVLARLKAGVESIQNSDTFREFLITMAKFHDYSIGNTILIMLQFRGATQVAGFNTWKELGRFVKAGEHGIMILAPFRQHLTETHHRTDVSRIVREAREGGFTGNPNYFKVVYVFDMSQTSGKELSQVEVPVLTVAANETLFGQALELTKVNNLTFTNESRPAQDPDIKGMLAGTLIWIRPEEARGQQLKTLLHELAHFYTERVFMIARTDAETIAESSSFVVAAHFGYDTGTRSFPYVATWSQDKKVLEKNLTSIRSVSSRMIDALEKITIPSFLRERKEPWQMTREDILKTPEPSYYNPIHTVGYRYGDAPESGYSYNTRENRNEKGVSLASAASLPESRSFATMDAASKRKVRYYEGDIIGYGGDDEPIMVNLKPITEASYTKRLGNADIKLSKMQIMADKRNTANLLAGRYIGMDQELIKWTELLNAEHKRVIQQALSEGKPVPASVLADYPDLKPSYLKEPDQYRELFNKLETMTPTQRREWAIKNSWGSTEDMAYKALFSSMTRIPLKKGETWRSRAVTYIQKYH